MTSTWRCARASKSSRPSAQLAVAHRNDRAARASPVTTPPPRPARRPSRPATARAILASELPQATADDHVQGIAGSLPVEGLAAARLTTPGVTQHPAGLGRGRRLRGPPFRSVARGKAAHMRHALPAGAAERSVRGRPRPYLPDQPEDPGAVGSDGNQGFHCGQSVPGARGAGYRPPSASDLNPRQSGFEIASPPASCGTIRRDSSRMYSSAPRSREDPGSEVAGIRSSGLCSHGRGWVCLSILPFASGLIIANGANASSASAVRTDLGSPRSPCGRRTCHFARWAMISQMPKGSDAMADPALSVRNRVPEDRIPATRCPGPRGDRGALLYMRDESRRIVAPTCWRATRISNAALTRIQVRSGRRPISCSSSTWNAFARNGTPGSRRSTCAPGSSG